MNAEDFLLELFKEENSHARHTEIQRLEVTKFILATVGVAIALMGTLKFSIYCLPFGFVIIALGYVGRKIVDTYVQRFDDHRRRARAYRNAVDTMTKPASTAAPIRAAHPIIVLAGNRVRNFWRTINSGVMVVGLLCVIINCVCVVARAHSDQTPDSFAKKIMKQLAPETASAPEKRP